MEAISLITGFFVGAAITYIISNLLNKNKNVSKTAFDTLTLKHNDTVANLKLYEDKLATLQSINEALFIKVDSKESEVVSVKMEIAALEVKFNNAGARIDELSQKLTTELEVNKNQQSEINLQLQRISELTANSNAVVENLNMQKETNDKQVEQIEELKTQLMEFSSEKSKLTANNESLSEKLTVQKTEIEGLQKAAHLQFEKIASQLLDEKSTKFTETNKTNLEALLNPLKEDIGKFKAKVEETHTEDTKQRVSLEERIRGLIDQTNKVSTEASNLATALKGKPQKRGNWGEMVLERILEMSGLNKDREYFVQGSIKDEDGNNLRPDVRINLPDKRVIMVDSKVSLVAYDNFYATENPEEQKIHLNKHLESVNKHIDQLSSKNYDNLGDTLDFTMMFIPIEPAYMLTIQADPSIWAKAYEKRILLVSPTNLIACLKLFSDLWKRDSQSKNASEIVKRGEALYEKFVGFTKTFEDIGESINTTQDRYNKALGQLRDGKGNIINQGIALKNLGLKSDKKVPDKLIPIDEIDEVELENIENS